MDTITQLYDLIDKLSDLVYDMEQQLSKKQPELTYPEEPAGRAVAAMFKRHEEDTPIAVYTALRDGYAHRSLGEDVPWEISGEDNVFTWKELLDYIAYGGQLSLDSWEVLWSN